MMGSFLHQVVNLCYMPPEILLGSHLYSTHVDVWSVGCIFAEMIDHQPLFNEFFEKDRLQTVHKIFRCACVHAHLLFIYIFPLKAYLYAVYFYCSIMGTPDATTWPGVTSLPDYEPDDFPKQDPKVTSVFDSLFIYFASHQVVKFVFTFSFFDAEPGRICS